MLLFSILTLGLASAALATPFKRSGSLTVKLSTPATAVNSIEDLTLVAEVTNTGTEDVKVLKYGTVLDDRLPTRAFTVTKDGVDVPFTGIRIQVSLADADETAYTTIPAGKTVTVSHAVAPLFDFASVGTGKFSFETLSTFQVAGIADRVASIVDLTQVETATDAVAVEVTTDVKKRDLPERNKRAVNICSTSSRRSFIDASYTEAKTLASLGSSYISSRGTGDALYRAYWKTNSASSVTSILNAVASENSGSRTLSCTDSLGACSGGVIAYTATATTNIYFCSIFFNEVANGNLCTGTSVASRNVRGGTTLHELTHAVGRTTDVGYGCAFDQGLSAAQSIRNADNFNCFTTQVYASTRC
ncbi:hypothetical protein EYR38_002352 [Pleurotus pulmonarius]|nr:hypothetical protein EYR38_002352 [Pleurotus pulmonarius]